MFEAQEINPLAELSHGCLNMASFGTAGTACPCVTLNSPVAGLCLLRGTSASCPCHASSFATLLEYLTYNMWISGIGLFIYSTFQRQLLSHPDGNRADANQLGQWRVHNVSMSFLSLLLNDDWHHFKNKYLSIHCKNILLPLTITI